MPRPSASSREVLGQAWSVEADRALADVTAALHHAARGNHLRAAHLFARAQRQLAEAELELRALAEQRLIAAVTKAKG